MELQNWLLAKRALLHRETLNISEGYLVEHICEDQLYHRAMSDTIMFETKRMNQKS